MSELDPVDKEFLYDCFSGEKDLEKRICEKYGLQRNQMQYKRKKLLEQDAVQEKETFRAASPGI